MDVLPTDEVMRRFESLLEITLCAICLETVRPDMVQCVNGHIFCSECKGDLDDCPTCRDRFSEDKPSAVISQVVEALPSRCKHKNCGKYLKTDDDHEKFCGFKLASCRIEDCDWKGQGQVILEHLLQQHPTVEILSENSDVVLNNFVHNEEFTVFKPLSARDLFFWYEITNNINKKLLINSFHFVPNGKVKDALSVKIKSVGNDAKFMFKINLKIDPDASTVLVNNFCVPNFMLPDLIKEDRLIFKLLVKAVK